MTEVSGLFFLGLHWMHSFRSVLMPGIGADAAVLAEHITSRG